MLDIIRRSPYRELSNLEREANRLFRSFLTRAPLWEESREMAVIEPNINVYEDNNNLVVEAQVPGLKKEDLKLSLVGDRLTISGEIKQEAEKKDRNYHLREVRYGSFERSIPLPYEVVADKAQAELKDGVLRVTLPKSEAAKQKIKQIEVKAA